MMVISAAHLDDLKTKLAHTLENTLPNGVSFAYLFGSQVTGETHSESDIDLAIFPTEVMSHNNVWQAAQSIAQQLNCDVDLINLREANTVLRFQIITEGILLIDKHDQAPTFEVDTFRMYQDLQYNRKSNIKGLLERWNSKDKMNG